MRIYFKSFGATIIVKGKKKKILENKIISINEEKDRCLMPTNHCKEVYGRRWTSVIWLLYHKRSNIINLKETDCHITYINIIRK
jgi:hypothetical protein